MRFLNVDPSEIGMIFDSWQEIDVYFNAYGKQQGFGVVRGQSAYKHFKDGSKIKREVTWKCDCAGKPDTQRKVGGKRIAREFEGEPVATKKSKKMWLRGHVVWLEELKKVPYVRRALHFGNDVGLPNAKLHRWLASQRNGYENVALTTKDLNNLAVKEKKLKFKDGDVNVMMNYFKMMQKNNKNFYHVHRLDDNGVLQDVLWVDARSRTAYEDFDDVVCFDTTFLMNKYDLPFANVVGVNHHGKKILLGCALISHEDTETFKWMFSTWLDVVGGDPPTAILTGQDPAMRKALKAVMPQTRHRWCLWHITEKFCVKLGKCKGYVDFKEELKNIIYDNLSMEEFELRWKEFIEKHKLASNMWLAVLYDEREMWIPAAMKHLFWARMKTTQRSESIHNFLDEFFGRNTRLWDFAEKYVAAMEQRLLSKRLADGNSAMFLRGLVTDFKFKETFRNVYTDSKFMEVQRECKRLMYCTGSSMHEISPCYFEHLIKDRVYVWVEFEKKEKPINKHCLNSLETQKVSDVPSRYILDRWRKDIYRKHTRVKVAFHDPTKTQEVVRYDKLMLAFEPLSCLASDMDETMQMVIEGLKELEMKVKEKTTPVIPISSVGEIGNRTTPPSVKKKKCVGPSRQTHLHLLEV
ncbi:protein FAR-RED IMPAIRED RESPONSE 1-like [Chenopodium quinoa]|uniref:protein FAR-RED IMPAIRED RESPONSE 1-like n=1 Tax=Chenopodium quinoa TaxID=63459 RepID=UPI000B776CC7|nr:protein FAR-RED IMPAIRED RESPONSE 1-like [Chenopodium quinoa]